LRTLTRETLQASHSLTLFVARTLSDLVDSDNVGGVDYAQPKGVMEGLAQAYEVVSKELFSAVDSVVSIPVRQYYHSDDDLPQNSSQPQQEISVMKTLPGAILKPMAGIAEGLSHTIQGLRNNIDPSARLEEEDIWDLQLCNHFDQPTSSTAMPIMPPMPDKKTFSSVIMDNCGQIMRDL